jgi:hypothetical protein
VEAGDFDFSAFERRPTGEETEQYYAAGEAGDLGPEWKSDGIGCDVAIVITLLGVGALFGCHWWWGASVVSISIELAIFALLVAVGALVHFRGIPDSRDDRVRLVQFARTNGIKAWFGDSDDDVPIAAMPAEILPLPSTDVERFDWQMAGRDVRAGEITFLRRNEYRLSTTRRYIAVRHGGQLPRLFCKRHDELRTHAASIKYSSTDPYDWHTVAFDDHDPPRKAVFCERGSSTRVRELFSADFIDELFAIEQARWIEADPEWISIRLYDGLSSRSDWEDAISAIDLVITRLLEQH